MCRVLEIDEGKRETCRHPSTKRKILKRKGIGVRDLAKELMSRTEEGKKKETGEIGIQNTAEYCDKTRRILGNEFMRRGRESVKNN